MKHTSSAQRSDRSPHPERDVLSLRFSAQDKNKIRKLAERRGRSASRSVMELVDSALGESKEPKALTIIEIMELPVAERMDLLDRQMREAAHYYTSDPDLIFEANDDMMEY